MNPKGQCRIEHNLMPSEVGQEFSKVLHRAPGPYGTYMYGPYIYSFTYKALCLLLFEKKRVLILKIEKKSFHIVLKNVTLGNKTGGERIIKDTGLVQSFLYRPTNQWPEKR